MQHMPKASRDALYAEIADHIYAYTDVDIREFDKKVCDHLADFFAVLGDIGWYRADEREHYKIASPERLVRVRDHIVENIDQYLAAEGAAIVRGPQCERDAAEWDDFVAGFKESADKELDTRNVLAAIGREP